MQKFYIIILSMLLTACYQAKIEDPLVGKYYFGYNVVHPARAGLVQVFDDGEKTYLQLTNKCKGLEVESDSGRNIYPVVSKESGKWNEYQGVFERLVLSCKGEDTVITRIGGVNTAIK